MPGTRPGMTSFTKGGMKSPTEKQILNRAYDIRERNGRPEAREDEFWHQAEQELRAEENARSCERYARLHLGRLGLCSRQTVRTAIGADRACIIGTSRSRKAQTKREHEEKKPHIGSRRHQ